MIDRRAAARARRASPPCCRFTVTRARIARTSRACPSRPSSWRTCWCCRRESHSHDGFARAADSGFFDIPVDHLYAAPVMYEYLKTKNLTDLVVVSPDVGVEMAHAIPKSLSAAWPSWPNGRKNATEVESWRHRRIRGKKHLLVDDLDGNGGDVDQAAALLKKKGAKRILACVSHAILNNVGVERMRKSVIDELITTDTVQRPRPAIDGVKITTLSVAGLLGEAIKRIHNNSSVNSLFEFKAGARVDAPQ